MGQHTRQYGRAPVPVPGVTGLGTGVRSGSLQVRTGAVGHWGVLGAGLGQGCPKLRREGQDVVVHTPPVEEGPQQHEHVPHCVVQVPGGGRATGRRGRILPFFVHGL